MVDLRLIGLYATMLLVNMIYSVMTPFFPIIARDKQLDHFTIGLIFSLQPCVAVLTSGFLGNSLYMVGRRNAYIFGLLSAVINM